MTGPRVVIRCRDEARAYRVVVDVAKERYQVCIRIDQDRVITPLEEMTGGLKPRLDSPSVLAGDEQHDFAERRVVDLDQHVDVIGHVAVRMNVRTAHVDHLAEDGRQQPTIGNAEENVLSMITAQRDVIHRAWCVNTRRSRHSLATVGSTLGILFDPSMFQPTTCLAVRPVLRDLRCCAAEF